ncbi:hypothetical protein [Paenisporosarcina indica]|uniref:hypothetical protein n=1 Tax=Paenisporosarcina indica TaxID=650093 RepID=UPI00094FB516|nr:hypothetical protein [Paenisporosarcina indica]
MAKRKNNSLLLAGLAAGAYAYFRKKENRDKALVAFNNTKTKVNSYLESQKTNKDEMTKTGHSDPVDTEDNKMVDEGSMTSVKYYNEEIQDSKNKSDKPNVTDLSSIENKFETDNK